MAATGKGLSAASLLQLADCQKIPGVLTSPQRMRREKRLGMIPKGSESPFGDFPPDARVSPRRSPLASAGKSALTPRRSPRMERISEVVPESPTREHKQKGTGLGGLTFGPRVPKLLYNDDKSVAGIEIGGHNTPREKPMPSPPRAGATQRRAIESTEFRRFYDRGDLPVQVHHGGSGNSIFWKVDIEKLDYHHYLPIFFDGLREKEDPYRFLAVQGVYDMLDRGANKILPVVPQLILPIKKALNTRDMQVMPTTLKVLQNLCLSGQMIGEALVPYYRQILPIFNVYKSWNLNSGDMIDYAQRKKMCLGELVEETLEIFEKCGGEDAFINIKYMIPTYESCILS